MKKPLILQICIPFCVKQCAFCAFPYCTYDPRTVNAYAKALLTEIEAWKGEWDDHEVRAISIEGGSPALLGADSLFHVLQKIRRTFHCAEDVTIRLQTMPGDYSRALMEKMRDAGVNHWIIGLETASRNEHELLARPYKYEAITMADMAIRTFHPRALGFHLLLGIPGQTRESLESTLSRCLYYAPEHIIAQPLMIPERSAMASQIRTEALQPMPEDTLQELIDFTRTFLCERGFQPSTKWDYVKPGFEDRCQLLQLQGCERLGLGYHSTSWMDGVLWRTGHSLQEYLEHPGDFETLAADMIRPDTTDPAALKELFDPLHILL